MKNLITRLVREDDGQDVVEYALLAAFISIIAATSHQYHRHGYKRHLRQSEATDGQRQPVGVTLSVPI